jgi:hypothetical protein
VPRAVTMGWSGGLGTIDMSCWARAVLFRVVPNAVNHTQPIWNSIASSALLRRPQLTMQASVKHYTLIVSVIL